MIDIKAIYENLIEYFWTIGKALFWFSLCALAARNENWVARKDEYPNYRKAVYMVLTLSLFVAIVTYTSMGSSSEVYDGWEPSDKERLSLTIERFVSMIILGLLGVYYGIKEPRPKPPNYHKHFNDKYGI
ncbi:MAG TPA: hypothetical protein PKE21_03390 [Flavobacteriales bacterium]|nr:hypothetical protein [Flavobacteriales bacterium]HMR26501.1 hypothetical protein [Flavobacteriales bacterium]